ncbi:protein asteroid [Diachasma alloeum]|uniref:protein asteroid n=1 Tax=Diachasma alloeum TaxID=454923 RepID=UPI0007382544|nr:protein asteroid [Diachasma alloeum]XP_015123956.1 protein asteroid [Diachasma alloeum]XP_028982503.1 protein asteroid [Diachasma alloeum]
MGIRGLTTYIANRSDYFFEPHELQNTYLVIDGWSLSSQIYCKIARCNCTFGGDYDQFSHSVTQFFEDLLRCQVTPIVLLDGGWENKKRMTVYNRARDRLSTASNFGPAVQNRLKYFPLMQTDVFRDVLVNLGIKFVMCPFEADECIAAVARILKAPVLSYDSDFYIYGVEYIPFTTLDPFVIKNRSGYAKRCKIYRVEKLLNKFQGLDASLLPLASILLGNDYIKRSTFKDFFSKLKLKKSKTQNEQQRRIQTILNWLRNYSLNSAVAAVLKKLRKDRRKRVLYSIELIINGYSTLTTYMLEPLGLTETYTSAIKENKTKTFRFQGDLDKLDAMGDEVEAEETEDEDDEEEAEEEEVDDEPDLLAAEKFASSVPEWFIKGHLAGDFPTYFINMLTHNLYILTPQIEDFDQPSSHEISIPIITRIFSLLSSSKGEENVLELLVREGNQFVKRFITVPRAPVPLEDLREVSSVERREIIDEVLRISEEDGLDNCPEGWRLYLGTMIFWMRREVLPERNNIHLNCLVASMLFSIIDDRIGFRRSKKAFERKFSGEFERIGKERRHQKFLIKQEDDDCSLREAVDAVDEEDCIMGAQFFVNHFEMDERLRSLPRRFCVEIVHAFAQFQSCLRHSMHLNALLGYPYIHPRPAELFNGTLLYNLYSNLSKRNDAQVYLQGKLENAPGLLRVFRGVYRIVEDSLGKVKEEKAKNCKRRRNKNTKRVDSEDEFLTAESDLESPEKSLFYDPRNPFSILTVS